MEMTLEKSPASAAHEAPDADAQAGRDGPPRKPAAVNQLLEFALPLDLIHFSWRLPLLLGAPRGDGRPICLLPGYGASELSMVPLKSFLKRLGYKPFDWGLGRNQGAVQRDIARFTEVAQSIADRFDGEPITLIGWSLGGTIAREVARQSPHLIREVITMGTPIVGGPKYTSISSRYANSAKVDLDRLEQDIHLRNSIGFRQPLTVIYSERDGVVGPDIARDTYNPQARNIRVSGGHLGLGVNPQVWRIIADTLAE